MSISLRKTKNNIRRRYISLSKCNRFDCYDSVKSLYLDCAGYSKQYDLTHLAPNRIKNILELLPIPVFCTEKNEFSFFAGFEAVIIATQFSDVTMCLDIFEGLSEEEILEKAISSLCLRFVFESNKNNGLAENYELLKRAQNFAPRNCVINSDTLTESSFSKFANVTKKALINQRRCSKAQQRLALTSEKIRGL